MPSWKKVITSGSNASLNSLTVINGITGSLFGTASSAISASWAINALTASYLSGYVSPFPYTGSAIITGSLAVTGSSAFNGNLYIESTSPTTPPLWVSASNLTDGIGAFRADSAEPDIYLNDTDGGFSTVTFGVAGDDMVAFGRNSDNDFYITRVYDNTYWDDTFVVSRQTGEIAIGYGATISSFANVKGPLTADTLISLTGDISGSHLDGTEYGYSELYYSGSDGHGEIGVWNGGYNYITYENNGNYNQIRVYENTTISEQSIQAPSFTGSLSGTSSYSNTSLSSSYSNTSLSSSYALSSSYSVSSSKAVSSSYADTSATSLLATTASYALKAQAGGSNTQIQINSGSSLAGIIGLTVNIASQSLANGDFVLATGQYSHAEGLSTIASGQYSHAEGNGTTAAGTGSHAEGGGGTALGNYSHVEGAGTIAAGDYQHVQGRFNITSSANSAFIIGNGTTQNSRSNLVFASGSTFQVTGSVISTQGFTGSLFGTSSWSNNATTASFITGSNIYGPYGSNSVVSASNAATASYVLQAISSSYSTTASYSAYAATAGNGGVTQIITGANISVSPAGGQGAVTVTALGTNNYNTMTGSYGAFHDTGSYPITSITTAYSASLGQTDITNGVFTSGSDKTKIYFTNAGIYNVQFSMQFENSNASQADDIQVWLRQGNGTGSASDVAFTTGLVSVPSKHGSINGHIIAGWNYFISTAANDYIQLMYQGGNTALTLVTYAAGTTPTTPVTPATILTAQRVDTFLSNTGSFSGSFTGTLIGTSSWANNSQTASYVENAQSASYILNAVSSSRATSSSFASTASYVNTLSQNVVITGSLTVGSGSAGSNENTLILAPPPAGGTGEGGQILLSAPGGTYTSASMFDNYQNLTRLLRGTNASSDAVVAQWNMDTKQMQIPAYNSANAFTGTPVSGLAVDSNGYIITNGYTPYRYVNTTLTTVSTSAESIVASVLIPGGTFGSNDVMKMLFRCVKGTTTASVPMRIRINTSNTLAGSTIIATYTFTTTAAIATMSRVYSISGTTLYGFSFSSSQITDILGISTGESTTTYNPANPIYVFFTVFPGAGDSITFEMANITN